MNTRLKLNISVASLASVIFISILIQISVGFNGLIDYIRYSFYDKNELRLNISLVNPGVKLLAADPSNTLILKVEVRDLNGNPVPKAYVSLSLEGGNQEVGSLGSIYPVNLRTEDNGEFLVTYSPPVVGKNFFKTDETDVTISASIKSSHIKSSQTIKLVRNPVVFVHGYQAYAYVFENFGEYLKSKGYETTAINYMSANGIVEASNNLRNFLSEQKMKYLLKGFQVQKFDIIAHSMGGLVARYYTCSEDYINANNVRKIIFISVPQKGSPWASIGATLFNDKGVNDLIPENTLLSSTMPGMINKGLNNSIQVGSILGQYDEVVSPESASLEEWNINTELFSLGDNNLDFNNILKGNFSEATNHMSILSNKKVFQKVENMLDGQLPYPIVKR